MVMKRRDFLRAALVTAGSILAPAACSDDPDTQTGACGVQDGAAYFPQSIASGDPRPDSVILWTRIQDPAANGDVTVQLKMALDEAFTQVVALDNESGGTAVVNLTGSSLASIIAQADFDRCVKVKVAGLKPGTTYYYRFYYANAGGCFTSRVGRTKTAPAEDAEVTVRFAYVSCQDFIGRYYNAYLALAQEELDFFVHLGDYVYETTGDPTFQSPTEARKITFTDIHGAIGLTTSDDQSYYAARSISNYRDLYRTYRSDAALQAMHERFPMIAIWDDHEFSDDCHGATAAYHDGRVADETDINRRKAANQAWFEYMPVDYRSGDDFRYDAEVDYPQDITIYRDFKFGLHLHLVLTDLRTYRADHLVPEGAFPGKVVLTEEALTNGSQLPAVAAPYVDVETFQGGIYKTALVDAAEAEGYDPAHVTGNISAAFINGIAIKRNPHLPPAEQIPLIDVSPESGRQRGISYLDVGKNSYYTTIGSRYFLIKEAFDVLAKKRFALSEGADEEMMGAEQETWFLNTITGSDRTWKVWANEFCLNQLAIDLGAPPAPSDLDDAFKKKFYLNCDAWDGFRDRRSAILEKLAEVRNVVAITGDIHAFYAGTPMVNSNPGKKIVEFVGSSISSKTFREELISQVAADPLLSTVPQSDQLAGNIDLFLRNEVNPQLAYAHSGAHGFCIAEVGLDEMVVTMHQIPAAEVATDYTGREAELAEKVTKVRFKTLFQTSELYMDRDDGWKRWDPTTQAWV